MPFTPRPSSPGAQRLPRDASLHELRPEVLTIATRECLLPGTRVALRLVLEGQPMALELPVEACLVVARERWGGYQFHVRFALGALDEADRHILQLFIVKGRGAPTLLPAEGA